MNVDSYVHIDKERKANPCTSVRDGRSRYCSFREASLSCLRASCSILALRAVVRGLVCHLLALVTSCLLFIQPVYPASDEEETREQAAQAIKRQTFQVQQTESGHQSSCGGKGTLLPASPFLHCIARQPFASLSWSWLAYLLELGP